MLEDLYSLSQRFLELKYQDFQRYLIKANPFSQRLSILLGQRGVGKTTAIIRRQLSLPVGDNYDCRLS